ncbi:MAG: hypothetical protein WC830_03905 [Burkholderiales bacterium]|jgi:hypothetical protein
MNKRVSAIILSAMMAVSGLAYVGNVSAEPVTIVGTISKIQLAPDGKSATAILKDNKSGASVTIDITDNLTLDKFKDKRIVEGDEIRTKFDKQDGKNHSKSFKKTAGC